AHPRLTELVADEEVMQRWNRRAELAELPHVPAIREQLRSEQPAEVEQGLRHLARRVSATRGKETHGFFSILGSGADEYDEPDMIPIPELDGALERCGTALHSETLLALLRASFAAN